MTFFDANTRWVLAGTALLGVSSGVLGSFALLRRRSLLGDALAHAALPGVCVAFLITSSRALGPLLLGALIAGLLGAVCIQAITRSTRLKEDAALGIVLSIFFAVGIVLLTLIQHSGAGNQAGLDKYVFGQAAAMIGKDVRVLAVCAVIVCILAAVLFKELKLLCFDAGFAAGSGFSPGILDGLLMTLLVLAVVIGLQSVGVVLMAAMLIVPAAAARLWTDRLSRIVVVAGLIGAASGALGTIFSLQALRMPTGPLIVLSASAIFGFSLLFAPQRGLLPRAYRFLRLRARVARENVLRTLYEEIERAGPWDRPVPVVSIAQRRSLREAQVEASLRALAQAGDLARDGARIRFTKAGLERAHHVVRNYRLWEMFLMMEGQLGADHVDRDADTIEHFLSEDTVTELEGYLEMHGRLPKLQPGAMS